VKNHYNAVDRIFYDAINVDKITTAQHFGPLKIFAGSPSFKFLKI